MNDEPSISPFKSTPLDRHGDDREAAAIEADQMFARYVAIPREAFAHCAALIRRRERYRYGLEMLDRKIAELDAQIEAVVAPERPRAYQYLRQAVVWFLQYVRAGKKRPPASWTFTRGEVRLTKNRSRTEWVDNDDLLDALRSADIPFAALEACQRVKVVPDKAFIGKHLEDREDGQYFVWQDWETGEVTEALVGVEEARPGAEVVRVPLRKTVQPLQPYKLEVVVNDVAEEVEAPWLALDPHTEDEGGEMDGD